MGILLIRCRRACLWWVALKLVWGNGILPLYFVYSLRAWHNLIQYDSSAPQLCFAIVKKHKQLGSL